MGIIEDMISTLNHSGLKRCKIIINGRYWTTYGKPVYCEVVKDSNKGYNNSKLIFFIERGQATRQSTEQDETDFMRKIPGGADYMKQAIMSQYLGGASLPIVIDSGSYDSSENTVTKTYDLRINAGMRAFILETKIYRTAKMFALEQIKAQQEGRPFNYQAFTLKTYQPVGPQELDTFMTAFWDYARVSYRDLVYRNLRGQDSAFVQRLYRAYPFYKTLHAFVPVFLDCSLFFNPMKESVITNSSMYKKAVELNRKVTVEREGYTLTAYFLTQEEICKEFHLNRFMRFSPQLWYDIFMGLLFPNSSFPSITTRMYLGQPGVKPYNMPIVMSESKFKEYLIKLKDAIDNGQSEIQIGNVSMTCETFQKLLESYQEINSLWRECQLYANAITRSGAALLDEKKPTVDFIYNIMAGARL